jgi:hypothetical protein
VRVAERSAGEVQDPALFAPTFWVVRDRTVISLGAALEISYAP